MWIRTINDCGSELRWKIETFHTIPVLIEDGYITQCFHAYRYYKNNAGEWELCKSHESVYISIEQLMLDFVKIDSNVDKTIISLQKFKQETQAKNLEDSLKPFVFNSVEEANDIDLCIKSEKDGDD